MNLWSHRFFKNMNQILYLRMRNDDFMNSFWNLLTFSDALHHGMNSSHPAKFVFYRKDSNVNPETFSVLSNDSWIFKPGIWMTTWIQFCLSLLDMDDFYTKHWQKWSFLGHAHLSTASFSRSHWTPTHLQI